MAKSKGKAMIKRLYSLYDKKANNCLGLYEQPNDLVAIRDFSRICANNDEKNMIATFAEDYALLCLGEFDAETGKIESNVRTIAEAKDYVKADE